MRDGVDDADEIVECLGEMIRSADVKPDSVFGSESELIKITLGRLKRPHLKQKQNRILKQYETKSKQTIRMRMRRIVSMVGALNGND